MEETGLAMGDGALIDAVGKKDPQGPIFPRGHGPRFDFARLLSLYYEAYRSGDDAQRPFVIKWFRGEYETKTEARKELGVNIIITDDDWYEYLKNLCLFPETGWLCRLFILIDELVNIYKIPNAISRQYNYEKILTMFNDTMRGKGPLPRHHSQRYASMHGRSAPRHL